jgi:hypothetical protein
MISSTSGIGAAIASEAAPDFLFLVPPTRYAGLSPEHSW